MAVGDGAGVPIFVHAAIASPREEVAFVDGTLKAGFAPDRPDERLIDDRA